MASLFSFLSTYPSPHDDNLLLGLVAASQEEAPSNICNHCWNAPEDQRDDTGRRADGFCQNLVLVRRDRTGPYTEENAMTVCCSLGTLDNEFSIGVNPDRSVGFDRELFDSNLSHGRTLSALRRASAAVTIQRAWRRRFAPRRAAAVTIQRAWRRCRCDPTYTMCSTVQLRGLEDLGAIDPDPPPPLNRRSESSSTDGDGPTTPEFHPLVVTTMAAFLSFLLTELTWRLFIVPCPLLDLLD